MVTLASSSRLFGLVFVTYRKFRTILVMSVFYACGQIFLALSATLKPGSPFHPYTDILALSIIALGTGGIKPCVAPFGGDQFVPWQTRMVSYF